MTVERFKDGIVLELIFGTSLATYPDYYQALSKITTRKRLREELKTFARNRLFQKYGIEKPTNQFLGRCATELEKIFVMGD